jgi:hypothetical protein
VVKVYYSRLVNKKLNLVGITEYGYSYYYA